MITAKKIKRSQAAHILKLIEQMTRAEVLARLGPFGFPIYADYYMTSIEKKNELLEYIYGTSNLVELGKQWKLLKRTGKVRRGKKLKITSIITKRKKKGKK